MAEQAEQIGELIYLPNSHYPYPFPVERPPHYWMTEQTGKLADAVEAYLHGEKLTPARLVLLREYLGQYLERAMMTDDADRTALLRRVKQVRTRRDLDDLCESMADVGVEPL